MTETDMEREVRVIIGERIGSGKIASKAWITEAVVSAHKGISGDDMEWYRACAYAHIRNVVRRCVGDYKGGAGDESDQQLLLGDGWRYIQKAYSVERKGEQVVVPIALLTRAEIKAKIEELRKMAKGCNEHANELARFLKRRRMTA